MALPVASLTVNYVVTAAAAFAATNPSLVTNPVEMISRVRYGQRVLFTKLAAHAREYLVTQSTTYTSTGSGGRTINMASVSPPIERLVQVQVNGVTINQVDIVDTAGELAPRYYVQGQTLVELNNEWSATPGTLAVVLTYVYGPTDLNPYGLTSQLLTLPDPWVDILVGDLAAYCAMKDYGRPPSDVAAARALSDGRMAELLMYLDHTGGTRAARLDIPVPTGAAQ